MQTPTIAQTADGEKRIQLIICLCYEAEFHRMQNMSFTINSMHSISGRKSLHLASC